MLVRTNSILLFWSAFPAQPIKALDLGSLPAEQVTPDDSTAHSANTSICSSEYGIVTSITSITLDVPTILMQQVQEDNTPAEDATDSFSVCPDLNAAQESIKDTISIYSAAPADDEVSLPGPSTIPLYYTPINEEIIYYKRREDYYPQPELIEPHTNNVLGTKLHGVTLDDSKGMPIFKPNTDKIKPRAMLRRLKTMVKSKNKLYLL